MMGLEGYINSSRWAGIHPQDKIIFALVTMLLAIFSKWLLPPLIIFVTMGMITVIQTKIPWSVYIRLFTIPAGFLIIGALGVGVSISLDPRLFLWTIKAGTYYLGMTPAGISQGLLVLVRSAGAVSCLFFLALSTPLEDLTGQLERWEIPYIMIEMMTLVYRFIFIFWEQAISIHTAQAARLGHIDLRTSLRSLGYLISSLFIAVMGRTHALYHALVARGYSDSLRVLEEDHPSTPRKIILGFVGFDLLILGIIVCKGSAWL